MKATCFIDTNVLLYRASTDETERPKRLVAEALLRRDDIGLSAQVLAATTVFSEDLAHGQTYDGVTVLNPFRPGIELPA